MNSSYPGEGYSQTDLFIRRAFMAVVLRLARHGQKKRPFYRIVAAEKQCKRDGRYLEVVGTYNPMTEPRTVTLKQDRVKHWIENGASTTDRVKIFIQEHIPQLIEEKEEAKRNKIKAQRKKRKERAAARVSA